MHNDATQNEPELRIDWFDLETDFVNVMLVPTLEADASSFGSSTLDDVENLVKAFASKKQRQVRQSNSFGQSEPLIEVTWTDPDPDTDAKGYLVVNSLVSGIATGGIRMRDGCDISEVNDLAQGMTNKMAVHHIPVGGAKGAINFDPANSRASAIFHRFIQAMRPFLENLWVTAEDLGVSQQMIDEIFVDVGLGQSFYAAIHRAPDFEKALERVQAGMAVTVEGGHSLGDIIGGYGVAQAVLAVIDNPRTDLTRETVTVAVQGIGTMGGATAWYLHEAGIKIIAIADATGSIYDPDGLNIPKLLDLRDERMNIDRVQLEEQFGEIEQGDRTGVLYAPCDVLVPAATPSAINENNVSEIKASIIVEAANNPTDESAELWLAQDQWSQDQSVKKPRVPVIPDFIANSMAAAWAWWLLQGKVGTESEDSFRLARKQMTDVVDLLLAVWYIDGVSPRKHAQQNLVKNPTFKEKEITIP